MLICTDIYRKNRVSYAEGKVLEAHCWSSALEEESPDVVSAGIAAGFTTSSFPCWEQQVPLGCRDNTATNFKGHLPTCPSWEAVTEFDHHQHTLRKAQPKDSSLQAEEAAGSLVAMYRKGNCAVSIDCSVRPYAFWDLAAGDPHSPNNGTTKKKLVVKKSHQSDGEKLSLHSGGQAMERSQVFPCPRAKVCVCLMDFFCSWTQFKRVSLAVIKALLSSEEGCRGLSLWMMGFSGCYEYSEGSMGTICKIKEKTFDPHPKL